MWHAEVISLTLRHYPPGGSYDERTPFIAVARVELLGEGVAFLHAALTVDGRPLRTSDWRNLARLLFREYGIQKLIASRPQGRVEYDVDRLFKRTHEKTYPGQAREAGTDQDSDARASA